MHFLASFRQDQVLMMCADSDSNVAMVWSKNIISFNIAMNKSIS